MRVKEGVKTSLLFLFIYVTGISTAMSNTDTKFEWRATESAPKHYPMKIIRGTFIYKGEAEQGLYVPNGGTISTIWGDGISNHLVGEKLKPLPDRLKIIFFSYAEKQFYKGEFDLPYEKILALFRDGVENPTVFPNGKTLPVYDKIMVGVAPGGAVAVWVKGKKGVEVFFGQAQKVDINPSVGFALPFKDKADADAYMAKQLVNSLTPAELESLKKDGVPFGLWARYRNKYHWLPIFTAGHSPKDINVGYLNGEDFGTWYLADKYLEDKKELNTPRPVPRKIVFMTSINGQKYLFEVAFEEFETMTAFEKLGANGKQVFLEFDPRLPVTDIRIRLRNDKESIELKRFVSEK